MTIIDRCCVENWRGTRLAGETAQPQPWPSARLLPGGGAIRVASSPFAVPVCGLGSTGTVTAPGLVTSSDSGSLASKMFTESQKPVEAWKSVRATGGDLHVASAQSTIRVDVTVTGSGGLGILPALAVLGSGVDVSSIRHHAWLGFS